VSSKKIALISGWGKHSDGGIPLYAIIVYYLPGAAFIVYLFSETPAGLNFFKILPAGTPAHRRGLPGNAIRIVGTSGILL